MRFTIWVFACLGLLSHVLASGPNSDDAVSRLAERGLDAEASDSDSDSDNTAEIQYFHDQEWVYRGKPNRCVDTPGTGASSTASTPGFAALSARQQQPKPKFEPKPESMRPDAFHSVPTRCNPQNNTEIQHFHNFNWELHYACHIKNSCIDVNGIGACHMGQNHYHLPAANDTTNLNTEVENPPFHRERKCSPENDQEVMIWSRTKFVRWGVCPPGYHCVDFDNDLTLTACSLRAITGSVQAPMPLPVAPRNNNTYSALTQCASSQDLVQWDGANWIPYGQCPIGYECKDQPQQSVCWAPSLAAVRNAMEEQKNRYGLSSTFGERSYDIWSPGPSYSSSDSDSDDDRISGHATSIFNNGIIDDAPSKLGNAASTAHAILSTLTGNHHAKATNIFGGIPAPLQGHGPKYGSMHARRMTTKRDADDVSDDE